MHINTHTSSIMITHNKAFYKQLTQGSVIILASNGSAVANR